MPGLRSSPGILRAPLRKLLSLVNINLINEGINGEKEITKNT